jgi:FkbM family methyltransferase
MSPETGAAEIVLPEEQVCRRAVTAAQWIPQGLGIEIGALHKPLPLPPGSRALYLDYKTLAENRQRYPELANEEIVATDLVDEGFTLASIADGSMAFLVANHALEHSPDPIGTLQNWGKKLRAGGVLFMAVPKLEACFDKGRPCTSLDHLIEDHELFEACGRSEILDRTRQHLNEFLAVSDANIRAEAGLPPISLADRQVFAESILERLQEHPGWTGGSGLMTAHIQTVNRFYDIHYHTFTLSSYHELLDEFGRRSSFELSALLKSSGEYIAVMSSAEPASANLDDGGAVGKAMEKQLLVQGELNRLRLGKHGYILYNWHDNCMGQSVERYGEWAENELELVSRFIHPGDIVLDIGANIGTHTLCFSRKVGPLGQVLSFEPQRLIFQVLCANVAINSLHNVHTFMAGVGETPTEMHTSVRDYNTEGNFGASTLIAGPTAGIASVPVVTIDGLNLPSCQLIKIDVEGMELAVLKGSSKTVAVTQPVIYAENTSKDRSPSVCRWLLNAGYSIYWHTVAAFNPDNFGQDRFNIFGSATETNILCLPPGQHADDLGLPKLHDPEEWPFPS